MPGVRSTARSTAALRASNSASVSRSRFTVLIGSPPEECSLPKRRDQIRMSETEMRDFIASRKSMQVATLGRDGAPHLTTLWFALVDGALVFETFSKSQKVRNLERDPRIAVLFEDGLDYSELRGVSINGRAELVTDPERVHVLARAVMRRNQPALTDEQVDQVSKMMARKRTAVIVHPEKIASWDHRKLDVAY
jgi:PPOX class probable F420-dependent enzyme